MNNLRLGQEKKLSQHIMVSATGVLWLLHYQNSVECDDGVVRESFLEEVTLEL